ncbi:uncharacterized protein LOC111708851 [Eurytemora carolleeae]|uniref:uncharacterized protein LOC111708851 n=1 Tax=Eurytemora carolleeae TaxID=1294199 RepID=UPI000C78B62A|nr:uncharacterized protein LOC111708851 [Eurytemora carolleeae]|eukprot:XP_023338120.1 uncharacterized protein LOC111708851 [Eurytemora affinis]
MKHTQHLVDIMEARIQRCSGSVGSLINRSKVSRTTSSSSTANTSTVHSANSATRKTSASRTLSNHEIGRELEDAKEAWKRRKNYDPLAASGRKKEVVKEFTKEEVTRKTSSSSLISPREVKSRVNSIRDSAPKSAGSRSVFFRIFRLFSVFFGL